MEYLVAQKIKEEWGDKPCDHPVLEKETYTGAFLVTWVCTTCGKEFTVPERLELMLERKTRKKAEV